VSSPPPLTSPSPKNAGTGQTRCIQVFAFCPLALPAHCTCFPGSLTRKMNIKKEPGKCWQCAGCAGTCTSRCPFLFRTIVKRPAMTGSRLGRYAETGQPPGFRRGGARAFLWGAHGALKPHFLESLTRNLYRKKIQEMTRNVPHVPQRFFLTLAQTRDHSISQNIPVPARSGACSSSGQLSNGMR
jgi:hypothetical protein